ncbi:hypothetical protein IFM89_016382 [Coptis chinensis]|uniref:DNA-directed RNA polymerase subunit n=1 Tax=Coptis chinensis TaxID=261450 RepID=A0A835HCA2_9MAGN|nr:hypothetical protein IFM89_016382 [Coptis chinensis]
MTMQLATESVDSVKFSFLTSEEVESYSFKQVTSVELLDNLDRPVPGGLYDPALGPLEDHTICKSCGQSSFFCTGHCGHIEFICPIFNPLLFDVLFNIVRKMCFSCHHFMDARDPVEKCASQAELILKGEIDAASNGDVVLQNDLSVLDGNGAKDTSDHLKGKIWTSLQYSRAMSMLDDFMKIKKKKCTRCMFKSPKITQPTFGWIHMDTPDSTIRRNVLREYTQSSIDEAEQEFITGGAENANDSCTRGIETDDDLQSSGAVYDGTPNSSTKAFRDLGEGNVPSEFGKQKTLSKGPLLPSEVKDHLKLLWDNETQLCSLICDIHRERLSMSEKKRSYSMFFIDVLLVPPVKFRPLTKGGDSVTHHPQTVLLSRVLQSNIDLCNALNNDRSQMENRSLVLQQSVNVLFGNKKSFGQRDNMGMGICQLLEKKEGLFRQKMMGKRVNYSCRSVISPDPYLAVNEIGIPPCFALKLTYPELGHFPQIVAYVYDVQRVTDWNVKKLRNAILNGPDIHPGATEYSDQFSTRKLSNIGKMRTSVSKKFTTSRGDTSRGDVTKPGRSVEHEHEGKVVSRHLQDGDIVLVNRQPTLHKPGIMAHVVRVLNGEKTIRMHYANCSTYNADFDGDEMNVHFPQDEIARAEAFHIVNANNQYIIPTSGDTKRGLIQDHIVSGVLLTKKDTFLSRDEYTHLLYSSGLFAAGRGSFVGKSGQKVSAIVSEDEIELLVPAILKPEPLWTGKQVITSLLNRMTKGEGLPPFTFEAKCTIDEDIWTSQCGDDVQFRILKNDFLNGVVDKAQFGKYGMVHTVQELYGSKTAGALLSGLSRLFTVFLQLHGFTCGVDDLLLKQNIDIERRTKLKDANKIVESVYLKFVKGKDDQGKHSEKIDLQSKPVNAKDENKERKELQVCIEKKVRDHGESTISLLDKMMSSAANVLTNAVNTIIFPKKTKSLSEDKSNSADK